MHSAALIKRANASVGVQGELVPPGGCRAGVLPEREAEPHEVGFSRPSKTHPDNNKGQANTEKVYDYVLLLPTFFKKACVIR